MQQTNPASGGAGVETSAGAFNEAYRPDGRVRKHWRYLLDSLETLGPQELASRQQTIARILRDDGATYNDYGGDPIGRPWVLDPIPLLIDSREWAAIEAGVRERAELLNLVLADLYGPRELLRYGVIPPELVLADRGFLREAQGITVPGDQQLVLCASDMLRGPDGQVRVISDRTQTPSGAGYALENRQVMSRTFPSLFRDSHVHRLSLYFNRLRLTLQSLAPVEGQPRVVILTPGAYNETYFEHSFLAHFLGYPLVQGGDLTVRDGQVWLKTLDGLSRVDVILRRVDDLYCDPVELKADSQLGISGLLEVVRSGRVVVANPLGSGILENRGLARYLPAAALHFFGREPALPSIQTYWCGDPADLAFTLERLSSLVIKPTCRSTRPRIVHGGTLSRAELDELAAAIRARPRDYVAQEYLLPANSPAWAGDGTVPRPSVLRSFAVADGSSYTVMPGGLTRVGVEPTMVEITNRQGSRSKDTWVLASEPERQAEETAPVSGDQARPRTGVVLPSRVVENLFWAGRYAERAESSLRLLRTVFARINSDPMPDPEGRPLLLRAVTQLTCTYPGFMDEAVMSAEPQAELLSVLLDGARPGSVRASLDALLAAVDQVKDFMSADTQRILNDLRDELARLPEQLQRAAAVAPEEELISLVTCLMALTGLTQESMVRSTGWHFLDMGRRIERTLQTISLLRSLWVPVMTGRTQYQLLETVLLSLESLRTFRSRYQRDMDLANGLDLLLLDGENPRSVMYQLLEMDRHLQAIAPTPGRLRRPREARLLLEAGTALQLADMKELAGAAEDEYLRSRLDQLLSRVHYLTAQTADVMADRYFEHGAGPTPMAGGSQDNPA